MDTTLTRDFGLGQIVAPQIGWGAQKKFKNLLTA
jgi:hypothetical protein